MVVYGRPPPSVRTYMPGDVRLSAVHQQMMSAAGGAPAVTSRVTETPIRVINK
jgi:hypothetical protein